MPIETPREVLPLHVRAVFQVVTAVTLCVTLLTPFVSLLVTAMLPPSNVAPKKSKNTTHSESQ